MCAMELNSGCFIVERTHRESEICNKVQTLRGLFVGVFSFQGRFFRTEDGLQGDKMNT